MTASRPDVSTSTNGSAIRLLASALVAREQFSHAVGVTFGTKRNLETTLGYEEELVVADYRHRYERGDIAERIVEAYPRATWAGGAAVVEDPDPGVETEFEIAVASLFDRLDVWARLLRADILAGLGRYSVILIGADGALAEPLPKLSGPDSIHFIAAYAEDKAKVGRIVGANGGETDNPRYGLPDYYEVTLGATGMQQRVHWSRVIHVAEGTLEDDIYGKPRLRSAWNRLNDLAKLVGGGAEAAWRRMDPGLHVDLDPEAELSEAEVTAQAEGIEEYIHNLARVIRTTGTKVNPLSATVSGFGPNADSVLQLISATTGIPHRILTGSERGELASAQDRNNWNDRVGERRREMAVPLVLQFLGRLIEHGALPKPEFYEVLWPETDELDEGEKAEVAKTLAEANKANVDAGGGLLVTADEIRDDIYRKGPREEMEEEPTPGAPGNLRRAADDPPRIVIVGGPRRGKSTLARSYREEGVPTFCGDPASLVKDPEFGVTYLPDGLDWSECSAYVAERWLTAPGPWCCEGVVMARALRKFLANGGDTSGFDVVVIEAAHPGAEVTGGQEQFTKSVMTVWAEIAPHFPHARILRPVERDPEPEPEPRSAQLRRNKQVKRERKQRLPKRASVRFFG